MRLRPALIMLGVFIIVIGGLALFVSMYEAPTTDELATLKDRPLFPDVTPATVRKVETWEMSWPATCGTRSS